MARLIEWLLGLEQIRWAQDAPLRLRWELEPPPWVTAALAVFALAAIVAVYRREPGSWMRRGGLVALRWALLMFLFVVFCRPALVLERTRVEPSHVALVVDTSRSMAAKDNHELKGPSRWELARRALLGGEAAPLKALLERNALQLSVFSGNCEPVFSVATMAEWEELTKALSAIEPGGAATELAGALLSVMETAPAGRLAAIVLATDGQATEATDLGNVLDVARARQIPVFPLRIGSPIPPKDVELGPVKTEPNVYLQDEFTVESSISATGLTEATPVSVQLVDEETGTVLSRTQRVLEPGQDTQRITLSVKPPRLGRLPLRVQVASLPGEDRTENNVEREQVMVLDARLRVLFVDGYPRYEYRYLKNALAREGTIEVSVLLLEADEDFIQEGTDPVRRFPETPEELGRYDVVLLGDVDPRGGWMTPAQMAMLLDFVANEGGGFGLIAGERHAPHRLLGTPLEKLLPVRIDPEFAGTYDAPLALGFHPMLTAEGRRSPLFRRPAEREKAAPSSEVVPPPAALAAEESADEGTAWADWMPELYWIAKTLGARPGASVLATHPTMITRPDRQGQSGPMPLLVGSRYGAGRIFFQATDETWRWRRRRGGEWLHDSYWVQLCRWLAPARPAGRGRVYVIRPSRRTYAYGQRVHVLVEFLDPTVLSPMTDRVDLLLIGADATDAEGNPPTAPSAEAAVVVARIEAARRGPASNTFEAAFVPPRPGHFRLQIEGLARSPTAAEIAPLIRIQRPDLEHRRPEANHEVLQRIADATGGRLVDLDQMESEFTAIRSRSIQIPDDILEPLWDSKLVLILFSLMIGMEWVLRKAFGLQ